MNHFVYRPLLILIPILLVAASCGYPRTFRPCDSPAEPASFEVPAKIRVALVLGSGGVKGMAHVGVLEELVQAGIEFDLVVGCSAGAIVGAIYCDNPCISDLKEVVAQMRTNNILDINLWTCRYGLSKGHYLRQMLNRNLNSSCFDELKIPLVVVATDLFSGELVPIGSGLIVPALQASCAIPFVFAPVVYRDRMLVDGGVINPLPVCVAKDLEADVIIAVDLCELLPQTIPTNLFGVAKRSAEIAFVWQNSHCIMHKTIVIKPKMCGVGTFDDTLKEVLYEAGRTACLEALPEIREAIRSCEIEYCPPGKKIVTLPCYRPL